MEAIKTAQEHQLKLTRVSTLMDKRVLSDDEERELNLLVDAIESYESVHYPIPKLSETVVSAITWRGARDDVPDDWIERQAIIGFYTVRVWLSLNGSFEASLTHNDTFVRSRLSIGEPEDLKSACDKAAEVAIQTMISRR